MRVRVIGTILLMSLMGCESTTEPAGSIAGDVTAAETSADVDGSALPDVPVADVAVPDATEPACEAGTGCFGEPCEDSEDCLSGLCGEHLGDGACTETCEDACPSGWSCKQLVLDGNDPAYLCVSDHTRLCRPCGQTSDCASAGSEEACVSYGHEGWFCGASCGDETPCPQGFSCEERETTGGGTSFQCVAEAGVCSCSDTARNLGLSTPCENTNEHGTCAGLRTCGADGLGLCDAATPSEELCNGLDDDCDGTTDADTCDDGNPCTADSCLGEQGCSFEPLDSGECLDDDVCTQSDHCVAGVCVGDLIDCDDENPCTDDSCDPAEGCTHVPNFAPCDDEEPCTHGDACKEGVCAPGQTLICDDGNPCTDDLCDESQGCLFQPHEGGCDDSNACTTGDACVLGACVGAQSAPCDDGNACTHDLCEPLEGCVYVPHTLPCNDGDVCTLGDHCLDGDCQGGNSTLLCNDGNPCTDDSCDASAGCVFAPNEDDCDDGSSCTTGDQCVGGACVGQGQLVCDDGDPCTHDVCLAGGGCEHQPSVGPCFDGDLCSVGDACVDGECVSGQLQGCDDQNPCTDDACDPTSGLCVHTANDVACDDGNACTQGDACAGGACLGTTPTDCADDNPCTFDGCSPLGGCTHDDHTGPCDDGDVCTAGDVCESGACQSGPSILCDDYNPCTENLCGAQEGCYYPDQEGECEDGDACTQGDFCEEGTCVGLIATECDDGNICTTDSCEPLEGCVHDANSEDCEDENVCTTSGVCVDKACLGSGELDCDDSDVCTDDWCEPNSGCEHAFNTADCDDGDACTLTDSCDGGQCKGVDPAECDDENPCTDNPCDAVDGCQTLFNVAPCDDESVCTPDDVCKEGQCVGQGSVDCDDGKPCTVDSCSPSEGCGHEWKEGDCDDLDACTAGQDVCVDGECVGGTQLICDDQNPCTADQCDPLEGCVHPSIEEAGIPPSEGMCSDGDPCTENDTCLAKVCYGSPVEILAPTNLVGPAQVCDDESDVLFEVDSVLGATEYIWSVPPGVEITHGDGTAVIVTTWAAGAGGEVSVKAANGCAQSASVVQQVNTTTCLDAGIIIAWHGALFETPLGWDVCDGSPGTPDLRDRFIKGVAQGAVAGEQVGSDGGHDHGGLPDGTLTTTSTSPGGRSCGGASCTWKVANSSHSHSLTHDHTMASSAPVPPYYELLFLKNISASIMPAGAVTAWAQEDAPPAGWSLCAGQDGVPDLRGRFLRSTGWGEDSGETGGSSSHDHTGASDTVDTVGSWGSNYQTVGCSGPSATDGSHSHSFQHDHAVDSSEHLPPYRNVDFLLADDNEAPQSGQIALWDEDLGSVPVGWAVCDGTNGTPDLQDRFPRGTPEGEIVGVLGGSLDHDHGSSSDPGGTTGMSGGGNGNCSDGGPYMAFHDHEANAHGHPPTLSAGHEPAATTLHFIMKL